MGIAKWRLCVPEYLNRNQRRKIVDITSKSMDNNSNEERDGGGVIRAGQRVGH